MTKVIVYIEETNSMADVTFPSLPHVVSLLHYDDVAKTPENFHPPAGYPVVCITVSPNEHPVKHQLGRKLSPSAPFQKPLSRSPKIKIFCCVVVGP